MTNHLILKVSNVFVYVLVLFINYTGIVDPENNRSHEDESNETLLTPAVWTFKIWFLIYGLLGGFVIYQFFPPANSATVEGIKWFHVIASILHLSFIVVWHQKVLEIVEIVLLLLLLIVLSKIYSNLGLYPSANIFDRLFIHYPFAIYTAWIGFATIVNFWLLIPALNQILPSILAIVAIGAIGLHFIDYYHRNDWVFSGTLVWGLAGIALNHEEVDEKPVMIAAAVAGGVIVGGILRFWIYQVVAWWRLRHGSLDESSPLLG
ncbi:12693_t:CDS:2 [Ambispora leptoticha]|uniref:12693_t:CDS:1 n=1 Tax=Ambispora leptoticha TaxID=144679 RepID=A0A9N8ZTC9_9GLOM|nr:12693_t:CDS:2 [Ambispora leptoticha]